MKTWQVAGLGVAIGVAAALLMHPAPPSGEQAEVSLPQQQVSQEPAEDKAPAPAPAATTQRSTRTVTVYFLKTGDNGTREYLVPAKRSIPRAGGPEEEVRMAVEQFLAGPTAAEKWRGLGNNVPPGAKLLGVKVTGETAELNFSPEIQPPGGSTWVETLLDCLTYTATTVEGVNQVRLLINGVPTGTEENPFSSEGALFEVLSREKAATPVTK